MFGFTPQATTSVSNYVEYASTVTGIEAALGLLQAGVMQPSAEALRSVSGTIAVATAKPFSKVQAEATSYTTGDSFATAINALADVFGKANVTPSSASSKSYIKPFADVDAKAVLNLGSVSHSFTVNSVDPDAQARAFPPSVFLIGAAEDSSTITVNYDFTPFTEDYDRSRTVYLNSINRANTVYIKK
jgi:hypothetical protein